MQPKSCSSLATLLCLLFSSLLVTGCNRPTTQGTMADSSPKANVNLDGPAQAGQVIEIEGIVANPAPVVVASDNGLPDTYPKMVRIKANAGTKPTLPSPDLFCTFMEDSKKPKLDGLKEGQRIKFKGTFKGKEKDIFGGWEMEKCDLIELGPAPANNPE
jgi:hypothetical protein